MSVLFSHCFSQYHEQTQNQELVCRTSFYTNDGTIDSTSSYGLNLSGTDLFILNGAGTPGAIHIVSVTAWHREMWYTLASHNYFVFNSKTINRLQIILMFDSYLTTIYI